MSNQSIVEVARTRVVLLDGGMGSSLIERGMKRGESGEMWNLERPDDVRQIQAAYAAAGSEVIQTNTFGATPIRLASHGLADQFEAVNRAAVRIAREAAGDERWVAGNLGPTGVFLPPVGEANPETLEAGFAAQAHLFAEGGADYLSVETMMDLEEALLALKGARRGAPDLPVSVTLVIEKKKRGFFTPMGNEAGPAMVRLAEAGADLVGANCSMGSTEMAELAPVLTEVSPVPVVLKPNAGMPEVKNGITVYTQDPGDFARDIRIMVDAGARLVGGCCGTDDRFISAIQEVLE